MVIRTLIVDDEALARRGLELRLRDAADFEIVGEAVNGREAIEAIVRLKPDLVFLDIQMPGLGGFDVLRQLPADSMPMAVFVTAYDKYALEA
ncbi:MAG: response regulator, partial [Gammaproteobacteria bacterium]|nr:response regulator [Gammaproteobacteria bacterium]